MDLLHLIENTFDRKRMYANPSSYPNTNPKAQLCFRTDEMTSFFDQVYRYRSLILTHRYYRLIFNFKYRFQKGGVGRSSEDVFYKHNVY